MTLAEFARAAHASYQVAVFFLGEVSAVMYDMDSWMWDSGWGGWVLMTVLMVAFWAIVIALLVIVIRYLTTDRVRGSGPPASQAQALLAERYARGEIDDDEYRQRTTLLREHR